VTAAVDLYAAGLAGSQEPLVLRYADGTSRVLPVDVWTAVAVDGDESMLQRCHGATLDVGCGPGRLTVALGLNGLPALGVDIAPGAVELARSRGALALSRSIFSDLPGLGRWSTALLADGNIGIGGDPVGLLKRLSELLAHHGRIVVEVDPPEAPSGPVSVRVEHGGQISGWFPWAHVSLDHLTVIAEAAGFVLAETWEEAHRWFAVLVRP
jgi:SAM-dependent methyltransferase